MLNGYTFVEFIKKIQDINFLPGGNPAGFLKKIDFLSEVDSTLLDEISGSIRFYEYIRDDIICRQGKFNEYFYLIISGNVQITIPTDNNPKYQLYKLGKGDFFGEEILFSDEPRDNSVISLGNCTILAFEKKVILELMNKTTRIKSMLDKSYIDRKLKVDLRKVDIFTNLNDDDFNKILQNVTFLNPLKDEIISNEGDLGDGFYLIRKGEVNVYKKIFNNNTLIAILGEGQFFGEMSLLRHEKKNATLTAAKDTSLVKISRDLFNLIIENDKNAMSQINNIVQERENNQTDIIGNPSNAIITRKFLDLNNSVNKHLNVIFQCLIETGSGNALLASFPGSRYPYVYPRDSACASKLLYKISTSSLKSSFISMQMLGEVARFILNCQRGDGYWGQRYSIDLTDKGIYKQEDNVAHGVSIICRYILAAKSNNIKIDNIDKFLDGIKKGIQFAVNNYYRKEIHLFYSTTSIHESAIEEGYSIWVNYAYLSMFNLVEQVSGVYNCEHLLKDELKFKRGFEVNLNSIFTYDGRFVRRLKPNGEIDLRPDITLLSPFYFSVDIKRDLENDDARIFSNSIKFIIENLWDPELGMLQRYLPFIEDPETHIHAGNGPWVQYTAMLAQYFFLIGDIDEGNKILNKIDTYKSSEGFLCEHLTTADRFYEFINLEWKNGKDVEKEFDSKILVEGIEYNNIIEELNHMKKSYDNVEEQAKKKLSFMTFATPLMWSHVEYASAIIAKVEKEISLLENTNNANQAYSSEKKRLI